MHTNKVATGVKVVSPTDDTPAAKAGPQANDVITHVDKESLAGLTLDKAVEKMRGPVDSPVTLTILRKGSDTPFDVTLVRQDQGQSGQGA